MTMLIETYSPGVGRQVDRHASDAEVANRAADLIKRHGHAKNAFIDGNGALCIAGALNLAATDDAESDNWGRDRNGQWRRLLRAIHCHLRLEMGMAIATWNDEPERTASDVINVLREVAKDAEHA